MKFYLISDKTVPTKWRVYLTDTDKPSVEQWTMRLYFDETNKDKNADYELIYSGTNI